MNVEYRCEVCSSRFYALPGGTRLKCRHHPEAQLVQTEESTAPDFLYVDEDGHGKTRDAILPDGQGNATIRARPEPVIDRSVKNPLLEMELEQWRQTYATETQGAVDMRWGVPRIQEEIMAWREEQETLQEQEGQTVTTESETVVVPDDADDSIAEPPTLVASEGVVVDSIPDAEEGEE